MINVDDDSKVATVAIITQSKDETDDEESTEPEGGNE